MLFDTPTAQSKSDIPRLKRRTAELELSSARVLPRHQPNPGREVSARDIFTFASTQLSQVITQVTAPAFLLGAVAAFISVLISRMNRIIHRSQALNAIGDDRLAKQNIVTIVPEYRGFDYVLVGDSILIIDPVTLEIVAVIPA